jgi:hypothetical protein
MAKDSKKKAVSGTTGLGLGLALVAASAAAGYFLYGKDGAKKRTKIKGWMLKAKGEVLEKIEKLKDVSEDEYNRVINTVAEKYGKVKDIDAAEVEALAKDLRKHWKSIKGHIAPKSKAPAKKAAAPVKKAVKKAAPKKVVKKPETIAVMMPAAGEENL